MLSKYLPKECPPTLLQVCYFYFIKLSSKYDCTWILHLSLKIWVRTAILYSILNPTDKSKRFLRYPLRLDQKCLCCQESGCDEFYYNLSILLWAINIFKIFILSNKYRKCIFGEEMYFWGRNAFIGKKYLRYA